MALPAGGIGAVLVDEAPRAGGVEDRLDAAPEPRGGFRARGSRSV